MNKTKLLDKIRLWLVLHGYQPNYLAQYSLTCLKCSQPCNNSAFKSTFVEIIDNKIVNILYPGNKNLVGQDESNRSTFTCVDFINHPKK